MEHPELLSLSTLPLLFYAICQLFVCKWFSLPQKPGESFSHLKSRDCKKVMEVVLLSAFQVKSRL